MPNKCTLCGKVHSDDAPYLVNGCDKCGGKFFFYVRQEHLKRVEEETADLTKSEVKEIERDVRDIVPEDVKEDETVVLDLEAIKILKPGKYMIDVTTLFTQRPIIIRVGPGKYEIDLSTIMQKWKDKIVKKDEASE